MTDLLMKLYSGSQGAMKLCRHLIPFKKCLYCGGNGHD